MKTTHVSRIEAGRPQGHRLGVVVMAVLALAGGLPAGRAAAAPTPITSLPYTISQPGQYQIAQDLTYSAHADALLITASNVSLSGGGHTLTGLTDSTSNGIHVQGGSSVTITGTKVVGFGVGIYLDNASRNTLTNNATNGNVHYGIYLSHGGNHTLTGNSATGSLFGIYMQQTNSNSLTSNTFNGNDTGLLMQQASSNNLHGNSANNNATHGFQVVVGSSSNVLDGNTASGNQQSGIVVGSNNTVHGNTATGNHENGLFLALASGTTAQDNNVSHNQVGIRVDAGSTGNTLVHNTAQGNSVVDLEDDGLAPCQNGWANNLYVTDNETGTVAGPMFGCIR